VYIKDLRIFTNRNLKDMAIIDDVVYSFGYQLENGISIVPFYYNKSNTELQSLVPYMLNFCSVKNVRELKQRLFKYHLDNICETPEDIIDRLF